MFGVSGTVSVAADYQRLRAGARMYFASKPGAPYRQWPFNQQAKPICTQINDFYVKYVIKDMANCSDLPASGQAGTGGVQHVGRCPLDLMCGVHFGCV